MSEVIEIVAYNPDWPRMFEDENGSEWSSFRLGTGVLLSRVASLWQTAQLSIEEQIATKNHRQHKTIRVHSWCKSQNSTGDFCIYLVNSLRSGRIWPANVEYCPQSWTLGHTFPDKAASHQASFTEILSIGGEKERLALVLFKG